MTRVPDILEVLKKNNVEFVVIGGVAAILRGSAYLTLDLDICYNRTPENFKKLVDALRPLQPILRGAPADVPFIFDERTIKSGLNFTFDTSLGELDIHGEVQGIGFYEALAAESSEEKVFGVKCRVLNIEALIKSKRFAGRKKDEPVILELEAIQEMLERQEKRKR